MRAAFRITEGLVEEVIAILREHPTWNVLDAIATVCGGLPSNHREIARAVATARR